MASASSKNSLSVEVKLLGQKVVMKTSETDAELVREITELVGERVAKVEKRVRGTLVPHQITLLAMMDLAADHVRARRRTGEFQREVEEKTERLLQLIESEMK